MPEDACCERGGPGYSSPLEAMKGPKEELIYIICVQPNKDAEGGDYLATVDVNPNSETYSQVIHRTYTNNDGGELHHSGWNICSSCHEGPLKNVVRDKLVLPCLNSDSVYIVDTGKNPRAPEVHTLVDGSKLRDLNVSAPHTAHCLASGQVMISTMGDREGNAKGEFVLLDGTTFEVKGLWTKSNEKAKFGYDFWYQPYWDTMVASEWAPPRIFKRGYQPTDNVEYGKSLNVFSWSERKLKQVIDLGVDGTAPLEVRFLHDPKQPQGFVGCGIFANVYRFYRLDDGTWAADKVIDVRPKILEGGAELNGLISDILLSMDDKYLYLSNWFHGDVRQYDITDTRNPKLTGQIFLGGMVRKGIGAKVIHDEELEDQPEPVSIKGRRLEGGPQMLQLSLDGQRLYVSSSLYSPWDKQFYPEMVSAGGYIVKIDILEGGGMKLDEDFLVDFGKEPNGPVLGHDMRYPGGDCTSDIWLAQE